MQAHTHTRAHSGHRHHEHTPWVQIPRDLKKPGAKPTPGATAGTVRYYHGREAIGSLGLVVQVK